MERLEEIPMPGTYVKWYHTGVMSERWYPALVLTAAEDGTLGLKVQRLGSNDSNHPYVKHVSDPVMREASGAPTPSARQYGGWSYHPFYRLPQPGDSAAADDDTDTEEDEPRHLSDENRVYIQELSSQGLTPEKILVKIRSRGVNRAQVEEVLAEQ